MVGHWPAGDYQHEDSKVLCAASAKSSSRLDHKTIGASSRLGRRIGMLARDFIICCDCAKPGLINIGNLLPGNGIDIVCVAVHGI